MLCKDFSTIILAAGKSIRMCSNTPKVLHCIGGKFILQHVIDVAVEVGSKDIYIVYGNSYTKEVLTKIVGIQEKEHVGIIHWVFQFPPIGTGHAVKQVLPFLPDDVNVLILYGDVPLLSLNTLHKLFSVKPIGGISLLTAFLNESDGYGRIIRKEGEVINIVEDCDVNADEKMINEVNTGIMIVTSRDLKRWVNCIENCDNINGEFYLTDIINMAWSENRIINTILPDEDYEVMGVNNKLQLVKLERIYQRKQAEYLLSSGVFLFDLHRFDLRGKLQHGRDVCIDVNVILEGDVFLGNRVNVGMGCILKNTIVDDDVIIYPYSFIDGAKISAHSIIGPFARIRVGTEVGEKTVIGNFVELKNTKLGKSSKINHVSCIVDTEIGEMVNVGAGVVVCNYDGIDKHKTIIGDDVFIGGDSQLIAPVTVSSGAKIGAGTTVTRDVSPGEMIISRVPQFPISSWKRSLKKKG